MQPTDNQIVARGAAGNQLIQEATKLTNRLVCNQMTNIYPASQAQATPEGELGRKALILDKPPHATDLQSELPKPSRQPHGPPAAGQEPKFAHAPEMQLKQEAFCAWTRPRSKWRATSHAEFHIVLVCKFGRRV